MRRSVFLLTPLIPLLASCEDGPNQPFSPATGTFWNTGDSVAATTDAGDLLTSTFGGSNKQQICSGTELQQQWGVMIAQPIAPPRFMAGVDLQGGATYDGLT